MLMALPPFTEGVSTAARGSSREGRMPCGISLLWTRHAKCHNRSRNPRFVTSTPIAGNWAQNSCMRLRGIFLGVAAALLCAVMAHDVYARGKSGSAARSSMSTGAHPHHAHSGSFPQRHFHSSFVAVGVGVPFYYYPGAYYYPGYYYPGYASPPPPPPGWYFCPAYN